MTARRPIKSRQTTWARTVSSALARAGISPNMISFMSMVFAAGSLILAFYGFPFLAALFIQLRLIANLMDGMVAMEFGKKSKTGDLWNDVPDRIADMMIILGAGLLAAEHPYARDLAWLNAALAVFTAYLRVMGASLKSPHYYLGPMAKPHRMALITVAFIAECFLKNGMAAYACLWIMMMGQLVTCYRRLSLISRDLEKG